ncbi:MAG TPA: hypothetical protein VGL56_12600 [Fimbriimonadaceae bacterium]
MLSNLLMVGGLTTAALGGQKTIDFYSPAATVPHILKALRAYTEKDLICDPGLANQVLVVDVHNVAVSELIRRIAETLKAEWKDTREGKLLIRTRTKTKSLADHEKDLRKKSLQDFIDKERAKTAAFMTYDDDTASQALKRGLDFESPNNKDRSYAGYQKIQNDNPAGRLLERIIAGLSADDLAAMEPTERLVLTNDPTPAQKALPSEAASALESFASEQATYAETISTQSPQYANMRLDDFGIYSPDQEPIHPFGPLVSNPQYLFLVVKRAGYQNQWGNFLDQYNFTLFVSDGKGLLLSRSEISTQLANSTSKPDPALMTVDGNIEFSALSQELGKAFTSGMSRSPKGVVLSDSTKAILKAPDVHDPLEIAVTDCFKSLAESEKLNLIANPPDLMLEPAALLATQTTPIKQFVGLTHEMGLDLKQDSGWLEATPTTPLETAKCQVDRSALRNLLDGINEEHRLSLDNLATFITHTDCTFEQALAPIYLGLVHPNFLVGLGDQGSFDSRALRIFGLLTYEQKQALANGRALLYENLSPDVQEQLTAFLYWVQKPRLRLKKGDLGYSPDAPLLTGVARDPTVCDGNGIPGAATLAGAPTDTPIVLGAGDGPNMSSPDIQSADELGTNLWYHKNKLNNGQWNVPNKFWLGVRRRWNLRFTYYPNLYFEMQLDDITYDPSQSLSFNQLPKDFLDKVEASESRYGPSPEPQPSTQPPSQP